MWPGNRGDVVLASEGMESLYPWLLLLAGLLVGALVGGAVMLVMERRSRGSSDDVREVRRELHDYREDVASHYAETAKRVNELTHAYKAVYDHLEDGAYRLVGEPELRRRLDDASAHPVTLEGIGQRSLQRPGEPVVRTDEPAPTGEGVDATDDDGVRFRSAAAGAGAANAAAAGTSDYEERPEHDDRREHETTATGPDAAADDTNATADTEDATAESEAEAAGPDHERPDHEDERGDADESAPEDDEVKRRA